MEKWRMEDDSLSSVAFVWRETFRIVTTALLSLLLPLSILLLARLSTAHYLVAVAGKFSIGLPDPSSFIFLYVNSAVVYFLISILSVAAFVNVFLNGRVTVLPARRLCAAWVLLFALQLCVGLGLEGTIIAGIDGTGFNRETNLVNRLIFLLGLHETMRFWSKSVVKPVVDDTVIGRRCDDDFVEEEERWVEKVFMAASFGFLWWWRLRDEIDSLVAVAELKRELPEGVAVVDFVGWWLYHLTVSIGVLRILKCVVWLGMVMLFRKVEIDEDDEQNDVGRDDCYREIDDKV